MAAPYIAQDVREVSQMLAGLDLARKEKRRGSFAVKKTTFDVKGSRDGIQVESWRMQDWDYKRRDLPTYARGLFTTKTRRNEPEIAVRGYDKFFNTDEVHETKWSNILTRTQGPYELTLKENGCIIFIAGLEDDTLIVCSKHSTGDRSDIQTSHASAGELRIEKQLAAVGKTKADLARELRKRNVTAVAELCDDAFEEHILAYTPDKAGLYLHGINLNLPEFATYPSAFVQEFADEWGFIKTGLMVMDDINEVKAFLEEAAQTGAHDGRDVEGFVIRCKMSHDPDAAPYRDWFFKYKFEEPYLMYRQWRECTKALISGKQPKFKKHISITEEYLLYARKRLASDPKLAKEYNLNHGIISLRDDFLKFKNLKGADAANMDDLDPLVMPEVTNDVILCPIATIGCGKTTIALALTHLFGWGHIQNDNISGKARPPRFTAAVLDQLKDHAAVLADRNNAQRHERKQIITDVKLQHTTAKLVCLNFKHDEGSIDEIRRITQERVVERGDNHQTIHAASDKAKFIGVMEGFINRFEPCNPYARPDDGFDVVIDLNPTVGSRQNLETVITELNKIFPNLVKEIPGPEQLDGAIEAALGYKPDFRQDIPNRGKKAESNKQQNKGHEQSQKTTKAAQLEYMSVSVNASELNALLEEAFKEERPETSRFYMQMKQTRRVQPKFHVTLMHRASCREHPELWKRYSTLHCEAEATGITNAKLGDCDVLLERIVFDDRVMAIVVRLVDEDGNWECTNRVAHITIGTRDSSVKPRESNDLLARWLEMGSAAETNIGEVVFENKPTLKGTVHGVSSR
ncbi:RNA ligase-domain-containing protein [Ilyonectria robusta]|uniref:RNA ligase-domain-containing protein n=1 Tax=Ilyonectria robusta TaxID=1079257 RepID=UPI001E8E9FD2|nr:RNA ligase-domain-containing protein [Ilyonectria robusta]KAH8674875.1 RNA ligase-domain-containing protein [Ilyonectria robusta]